MQVTVYRDPSGFDTLQSEWNDLLGRAATNLIFMTHEYQRTWWNCLGQGELFLLAIRTDDGRLVGVIPLFGLLAEDGRYYLNMVGCVEVSDYLDLMVDKDYLPPVHQTFLDYLAQTDEITWDVLSLCSLPQTSPSLTQLVEAAQQRGWSVTVREQNVCPVISLGNSWDDYLAGVNKKQRHEIRRKIRRLETETEVQRGGRDLTARCAWTPSPVLV